MSLPSHQQDVAELTREWGNDSAASESLLAHALQRDGHSPSADYATTTTSTTTSSTSTSSSGKPKNPTSLATDEDVIQLPRQKTSGKPRSRLLANGSNTTSPSSTCELKLDARGLQALLTAVDS